MLRPLFGTQRKPCWCLALTASTLLSNLLGSVARPGSGTGADCLLPGWSQDLAPVYGSCRSALGSKEWLSLNDLNRSAEIEREAQWIVLWKDASAAQQLSERACKEAESTKIARDFQGSCAIIYNAVIPGLAISLSSSGLQGLLERFNGSIASVHEDTSVEAADLQLNPPWSLDRLDQETLPLDNRYHFYNLATGVNVYIIDTGVRTSHREFRYMDGAPGSRASEVYSSLTSGYPGEDCNGHGTHVAGTVGGLTYGPAKNVTLLAVRSLECLGNGTVSQVIDGLDWVQAHHQSPAVAVMALGGDAQYALDLAVHNLVAAGVTVMVAAGNEDTDACTKSPAREPLATTVAAIDMEDERLWISPGTASNYGSCVKVWAPGTNIQSASTSSDTATEYRSGTSQAAPFVAGAIALYLQNNTDASPSDIATAIASWGSWGQITEASQSAPNGTEVLSGTANLLLNPLQSAPVEVNPNQFVLQPGNQGPFSISVSLTEALSEPLTINVSVSDPSRGSVQPLQLFFDASESSTPQQATLDCSAGLFSTADSSSFTVSLMLETDDFALHQQQLNARVFDRKGNGFSYPKTVTSLPFRDTGNTYLFDNTYALSCGSSADAIGQGRDAVYYFEPEEDCDVTISLCSSRNTSQPIDTLLFVVADLNKPDVAGVICNDDFCGQQSQLRVQMTAGVGYGIIVDAKHGQFGTYEIEINATQGSVGGSPPLANTLQQVQQNIPQSMLAGFGTQPYPVARVSEGMVDVAPFPPPPPAPSIGTVAGPPAPDLLPAIFDLAGVTGTAGQPVSNLPSGNSTEVAVSSSGGTPPAVVPSGPPTFSVKQVRGPPPSPTPAKLPSASAPAGAPTSAAPEPASGPFQVRKIEGPGKPPPPVPPPPGPPVTASTVASRSLDSSSAP